MYVEERFKLFVEQKLTFVCSRIQKAMISAQEREHARECSFSDRVEFNRRTKKWTVDDNLPTCLCQGMVFKILQVSARRDSRDYIRLSWMNCQSVGRLPWDIAKVFMMVNNDWSKNSTGEKDVDLQILCNMLRSCDLFLNAVSSGSITEVFGFFIFVSFFAVNSF